MTDTIDNLDYSDLDAMQAALDAADTEPETQPDAGTDVNTAPSAAVEGEHGNNVPDGQAEPQQQERVVLSKDGKHAIPYEVLERERNDRKALAEQVAQLQAAAAERDKLTQVLAKHGIDPTADPDAISLEKIEQLEQDYPDIGQVISGMAKQIEQLKATPVAAHANPAVDQVQTAINAVPDLAAWQQGDPDRFTFAVDVDSRLQSDPAWKYKPMTERFAEVAKRTRAAFGDQVQQPAAQQPKPVEAKPSLPASPSEIGQTVQHTSKAQQLGAMTNEQLMSEMSGMTPDQIEQLLSEVL